MYLTEYLHYILYSFYFSEIGCVHQYPFSMWSNDLAESIDRFAIETAYIYKVVNDLNLFFDVECLVCFIAQVLRYCSDRVALIDRKGNNRGICFIFSYQCNISAVKSSDHGDFFAFQL